MKIFKKIEDAFAAVAFAEAGEHETAREMLKDDGHGKGSTKRVENVSVSGGHEDVAGHPSKA